MEAIIRPSAALRNNYSEISRTCREERTPVIITKNGIGDTVLMGLQEYNQMTAELELLPPLANNALRISSKVSCTGATLPCATSSSASANVRKMRYQILRTDKADEQLRDIIFYIADDSGSVDIALNYLGKIEKAINNLKDFPYSGSVPHYATLRRQGYRVLIVERHLVFYKINESQQYNKKNLFHFF